MAWSMVSEGPDKYGYAMAALRFHLSEFPDDDSAQISLALLMEATDDLAQARAAFRADLDLLKYPRAQRGWQRLLLARSLKSGPLMHESGFALSPDDYRRLYNSLATKGCDMRELRWIATWIFTDPGASTSDVGYLQLPTVREPESLMTPGRLLQDLLAGAGSTRSNSDSVFDVGSIPRDTDGRLSMLSDALGRTDTPVSVTLNTDGEGNRPVRAHYCALGHETEIEKCTVQGSIALTLLPGLYRVWVDEAEGMLPDATRIHLVAPDMDSEIVLATRQTGGD